MAAVTESEVARSFSKIGEDPADKDFVGKCVSLCQRFSLSAGDLADHWESFAVNHDGSRLGMSSWAGFETEVAKSKVAASTPTSSAGTASRPSAASRSSSRPSSASIVTPRPAGRRVVNTVTLEDLASSGTKRPMLPFSSPDPKARSKLARQDGEGEDGASLSPTSVQSPPDLVRAVYSSRKNAGQKTASFNPALGLRGLSVAPSPRQAGTRCDVVVDGAVGAPERYRYMYTPLDERAAALEKGLVALQDQMERRLGLTEITPVGVPRQEQVVAVGRVCCESTEGKINRASILLEGSRRDSSGQRVHLDLRELQTFALFPGQVVAVQGVNGSGGRMVARGIIDGVPRPLPSSRPSDLLRAQHGAELGGGKALSIFAAAGPFTTSDSLVYEPLNDLLGAVRAARPDVVVLMGPFVDAEHPKVASGDATIECVDGGSESVDFETLFRLRLSEKLDTLFADDRDLPTQFVLVPSLRDVFHEFVYPQPPFHDRVEGGVELGVGAYPEERMFVLDVPKTGARTTSGGGGAAARHKRVHLAPNPAWLRVNEVMIGVSSTDALFDLSGEEVSAGGKGTNRLARLAGHLLQQQSFYPLFPPPAGSAAQLDMRHAHRWGMPATPDVLLVPSRLAQFARQVQGCLCVNPGQLSKGMGGGTYAELAVHPIPQETLAKKQKELADKPDATIEHDVAKRTCVEIRRI
ncbi:unnamed protein product [Ectocarpus sp. CCAP 1310/34]|nr:unnamed protein product [Ectocarpus sp. CCAP 1310/34]